jgi:hypothetical protein
MATKELWDKLRLAQRTKNGDAALAFKNAIECSHKGKEVDAAWWERQGDMAMPTAEKQESLSVGPSR